MLWSAVRCCAGLCCDMIRDAMLCCGMMWDAMLCCAVLFYDMRCCAILCFFLYYTVHSTSSFSYFIIKFHLSLRGNFLHLFIWAYYAWEYVQYYLNFNICHEVISGFESFIVNLFRMTFATTIFSVLFCSVLFCSVLALFCFVMFWFDLICFVLFSKMIFSIVNDPWVNCSLRYSISHYRLMAIFFSRIQNLQLFIPPMSYSSFFTSSAWFTLVLCYVTLLFTIPHFILSYHIISYHVVSLYPRP